MAFPAVTVHNADVDVLVRSNGRKLGTVRISKGTIDWMPARNSKTHYKMSWERFHDLMVENGRETT